MYTSTKKLHFPVIIKQSNNVTLHCCRNLFRDRQKVLTEAVAKTVSEPTSRLIMALTETVFMPASVNRIKKLKKEKARRAHHRPAEPTARHHRRRPRLAPPRSPVAGAS
jgi:hypothetical protein